MRTGTYTAKPAKSQGIPRGACRLPVAGTGRRGAPEALRGADRGATGRLGASGAILAPLRRRAAGGPATLAQGKEGAPT